MFNYRLWSSACNGLKLEPDIGQSGALFGWLVFDDVATELFACLFSKSIYGIRSEFSNNQWLCPLLNLLNWMRIKDAPYFEQSYKCKPMFLKGMCAKTWNNFHKFIVLEIWNICDITWKHVALFIHSCYERFKKGSFQKITQSLFLVDKHKKVLPLWVVKQKELPDLIDKKPHWSLSVV